MRRRLFSCACCEERWRNEIMVSVDAASCSNISADGSMTAPAPLTRVKLALLVFCPSYWAGVRNEAEMLVAAFGAERAAEVALREAEETLSPAWAIFMRRVARRIMRQAR